MPTPETTSTPAATTGTSSIDTTSAPIVTGTGTVLDGPVVITTGGIETIPPKSQDETQKTQPTSLEQALLELANVRKALKDANSEAAERRKKLEAYEAKEHAEAEAKKTELQKANDRAQEAETQRLQAIQQLESIQQKVDALVLRREFSRAASEAKIVFANPQAEEDAYALLDKSKITKDEKGNFVGLVDAVKATIANRPHLIPQRLGTPLKAGQGAGTLPQTMIQQENRPRIIKSF